MFIRGGLDGRYIRVNISGFGADRLTYRIDYTLYGNHLNPCFDKCIQNIKRK